MSMPAFLPLPFGPGGYPPVNTFTYYDYLVVIDFEATCEESSKTTDTPRPIRTDRPEIIQFPAILIDVRSLAIVDYFDSFVKPCEKPTLSEFCTNLTGITQAMVDEAPIFSKVLRRFESWMKKHGLNINGKGRTFAIVADGSYDMAHFLFKQSIISNLPFPSYARRWVNIRTCFSKFYRQRWFTLKSVLELIGQPFEGRQHNGLDDAKNIATVVLRLLHDGCVITKTEAIVLSTAEQEENEKRILKDDRASKFDLATVKSSPGVECIYLLPNKTLYRCRPETDLPFPILERMDNKENMPGRTTLKKNSEKKTSSGRNRNKKSVQKNLSVGPEAHGKTSKADNSFIQVSGEE